MSDNCTCRTCGLEFKSTAAFDKHRIGEHGVNRRCRTADEMGARGMAVNARGQWITSPMRTGYAPGQ